MNRELELDVAGQKLKIRTDEDEAYMRSLAEYVSAHMRELSQGQKGITTLNLALLAALRIADELHKRDQRDRASHEVVARLTESVEAAVAAGAR